VSSLRFPRFFITLILLVVIPITALAKTKPPVKIVFTPPSEDAAGAIRKLVKRFNRMQPQIKVILYPLSSSTDAIHNTYVTSFMAKDPGIDVIAADVIWPPEFATAQWIEPLDHYFPTKKRTQFLRMTIDACTYKKHIWAVPWFTDTGLLYYRKDLLKRPPRTWKELIRVAQAKMKQGVVPYGYVFQGNQYEGLVCNVLEFIWSNGGEVMEDERIIIHTPQTVAALKIISDLVKSGICPKNVTGFQEEDGRLFFQDGNTLFLRSWPNVWALVNSRNSKIRGKVGIATLPIGPSGTMGQGCLGGWNLMINRYSRNKAAAWKFIKFMTSKTSQKTNAIIAGRLPTRYSVYQEPQVLQKNQYYRQILPIILKSKPRPVSTVYPALSEIMQNYFFKAVTGQISAETAILNIEREMQATLQR
jgi:multiple sugar transport system substrate-binding protein